MVDNMFKLYFSMVESVFYGEDISTGDMYEVLFDKTDRTPVDMKPIGTIIVDEFKGNKRVYIKPTKVI